MELTEEAATDVTIVAVAGRLDTQTSPELSLRLGELLHSGHGRLLIEASRLTYIGSAGFRALLLSAKTASAQGGCVALCSVTAAMRRMIELAGLGAAFPMYASREEALSALGRR